MAGDDLRCDRAGDARVSTVAAVVFGDVVTPVLAQLLWQSPSLTPAALAVLAIALAAVLWLYPPQLRVIARRWRWGLPILRTMAVVALAVAMLRPVVVRPSAPGELGAIVVLADRSLSMSVNDRGRTP